MDDLVRRLRESAQAWDDEGECGLATLEREAADRIKQLEAMLRNFLTLPMYREGCGCGFCVLVDDTRTTLGETKDV